jgi:hypothetical protein
MLVLSNTMSKQAKSKPKSLNKITWILFTERIIDHPEVGRTMKNIKQK